MVIWGFCVHTFKNNMKQRFRKVCGMEYRGRIGNPQKVSGNAPEIVAKTKPAMTIRPSRVYRAAEDKWYDIDEFYELQKKEQGGN